MNRQQESEGFRNQESFRSLHDLNDHQNDNQNSQNKKINTVKHIYLEEENVYGRFAPYLLLKDKLKSQLDSSGNSVLHHMCSHDSPYLPLYLSTLQNNDPVLNLPSKMGHKPIDVAGIYCRKQYVELLKQKGAIDNGNIDHWAIQGGNIQNWTGKVNIQQKHLIHWAAYNDMPQVLIQFYKQGADMNCKDGNDCTPLDLAVINKSYNSIKALAELGFRPQQKAMKNCDSKSIKQIFRKLNQSAQKKRIFQILKLLYIPLYFLLNIYLLSPQFNILFIIFLSLSLIYWLYLLVKPVEPEARYSLGRSSSFFSDIIQKEVNLKSNHLSYVILILNLFLFGTTTIFSCNIGNYFLALIFWIVIAMTLCFMANLISLIYGIINNLSHKQVYNSHECKDLWKKIKFIEQRQIFTRKHQNPFNKGVKQNIKAYLAKEL